MKTTRLEAFSDGVIAIIITIMVLELKVPGEHTLAGLLAIWPVFFSYGLSFLIVAIYWINHHHLIHLAKRADAGVLWANLNLLFWLSLFPFATAWVGENRLAPIPTAIYGCVLLLAAMAYFILQSCIIAQQGPNSLLAAAVGRDVKGKVSLLFYLISIAVACLHPWMATCLHVLVALIWLVPDRRIERALRPHPIPEGPESPGR